MTDGRTQWYPEDADWLRWERMVVLGREIGPAVVSVLVALKGAAKRQSKGWVVKTGFTVLAGEAFTTPEDARRIVERAAEVGLLDELEIGEWTFTCRVSGMATSERRARDAARKQAERGSTSADVDTADKQDTRGRARTQTDASDALSRESRVDKRTTTLSPQAAPGWLGGDVWNAYVATRASVLGSRSQPKLTDARRDLIARRMKEWPADELLDAVRGWRHFPHNRGENDSNTPYCDLELILRDAARIEKFRDAERGQSKTVSLAEQAERHNAAMGNDLGGAA